MFSIDHISNTFKALSDPTRLRILFVLLEQQQLCVGAIAERVDMSESAVSHQLRVLRQHRIVRAERQGRNVLYQLDDDHITTLLHQVIEHHKE